jgi:hypothetical protein
VDLPLLHPLPAGSDSEAEQQVACHLYDPRFTAVFPTTAAIAAKYEALAEGSGVR